MATKKNTNFFDELNQLGQKQNTIIAEIERLKESADEEGLEILETIERDVYATIIDIDSAKKKIDAEKTKVIELKTFLRKGMHSARIGNRIVERDPHFGIPV